MSIKGNTETRESLVGNIHLLKKIPGYSAYEIAVKHGFKGTEAEWLVSLQGKDGYTPQKGVDYFDGEKGDPGEKGEPGSLELSGEMDAHGLRIKNVADPEDEGDAINKKYFDTAAEEAVQEVQGIYEQIETSLSEFIAELAEYLVPTPISADFLTPCSGENGEELFSCENITYKCGNVISGSVSVEALTGKFEKMADLFEINASYAPAYPVAITSVSAYDNDDNIVDIPIWIVLYGSIPVYIGEISNTNIKRIQFSFTYICK